MTLVVENVQKLYQGGQATVAALRDVNFTSTDGEFIVLRGPSGCGKSTLLHILGGMDAPTRGRIVLNGVAINGLPAESLARLRRREIGFVFQLYNLLPTLTALENVALPLTLDGVRETKARARARQLLDRVGLADRAEHYPSQLSGGQMQRVAVVRAVAAEPSLLLADEPTGSLDRDNGQQIIELLAQLNRELRVTVILATHADLLQ